MRAHQDAHLGRSCAFVAKELECEQHCANIIEGRGRRKQGAARGTLVGTRTRLSKRRPCSAIANATSRMVDDTGMLGVMSVNQRPDDASNIKQSCS